MKRFFLLTVCICMLAGSAFAQRQVSGTVTSADDGFGLPGVTVRNKDTGEGMTTDLDGKYKISVGDNATLVFSYVGYISQEVSVGARSVIDIILEANVTELSEVVVTALGVSRDRRSIGYAAQNVAGDEIAQARESNIVNALQGQVAGVQISGTAGALGGSSRITIRGANSFLGNNQPLFVVDGVPINNANYAGSGQARGFGNGAYDYGNAASDINPDDIASMTVLKGASATAIYGARGANGVILITTKNGSEKKGLGISVNSSYTANQAFSMMPHQRQYGGGAINASDPSGLFPFTDTNGQTYLAPQYEKDGAWGPAYDPNVMVRHWDSFDPNSPNYRETRPWVPSDNGYQTFFETGYSLNNNIALSGSNDAGSIRLSYTNLQEKGILPNSNLSRNTFAINSTYKLTDRLSASATANYIRQDASGRTATGYDNNNPLQAFYQWFQPQLDFDRLEKYYKASDGSQQSWNRSAWDNSDARFFDNPYWVRYENLQKDRRDRIFGNFALNYDLGGGFSVSGKAMTDTYTFRAQEGRAVGGVDVASYSETTRTYSEVNLDGRISYANQFGSDWSLEATLGGNRLTRTTSFNTVGTQGGLALPGYWEIANSKEAPTQDIYRSEKRINSVFATASIGWRGTLFLDASLRRDWSSTLAPENYAFSYPAVSASFVFTELAGLQGSDFLSFGKIRANYGVAGNDTSPYNLYNTYTNVAPNFSNSNPLNSGSVSSLPRYRLSSVLNNPTLDDERTNEIEFGIETMFFNNRLGLDIAYYSRTSINQLFSVSASAATGFSSAFVNAGSMRNRGLEVVLSGSPIKTQDFQWNIRANYSNLDNEVLSLKDSVKSINLGGTWAAELRVEKGYPYMSIFGQDYVRDANGNRLINADGTPQVTDERVFLGSSLAKHVGGIMNSFSYKGINLSAMVDYQFGGYMHSTSLQWATYSGMLPVTVAKGHEGNTIREDGIIVEGVFEDGTPNNVPINAQNYYQSRGQFWGVGAANLYKSDFVKLREVRLGYTLPASIMGNLPIRDVNISIVGRNLAILYKDLPYLDPQVVTSSSNRQGLENAQVPPTRSLGVNLSFKL